MYHRSDSEYSRIREASVGMGSCRALPRRHRAPRQGDQIAPLVRQALAMGAASPSGRRPQLARGLPPRRRAVIDFGGLQRVEVDAERGSPLLSPGHAQGPGGRARSPPARVPDRPLPHGGLGGYLLAGGYGLEPAYLGPACWSVEAVDAVTMDGEERTIDEACEPDLFWAVRGGGSGFPAIATRFHLRVQPLPGSPRCDRTTRSTG